MRHILVLWHRWVGLAMAAFLIISGLTGAIIAFEDELDAWLNPQLFRPVWQADKPVLDPYALQASAQQQAPANTLVDEVLFKLPDAQTATGLTERVLAFRLSPADPRATEAVADQLFIDPQTGASLGVRKYGESLFQRETLITFLYRLHYSLALPGKSGHLIMGIVALLWTLDTFVAFALTLPRRQTNAKTRFWHRWRPAWMVKWQASVTRINFDLHRALGLWLCTVLLIFAWSSVMFNLRDQVYLPVMTKVMPFDLSWRSVPKLDQPLIRLPMPWPEAHQMARQAMLEFSQVHGLTIDFEDRLRLDRVRGVYMYSVHSSADLREDRGNTAILIDVQTGKLKGWWLPTKGEAGNTFSNWLGALHMGQVFGLPYRIFVCLNGVALVAISVTGVLIWSRKRAVKKRGKSSVRAAELI
ncbi:PepSY domain-containing protein [Methylophilus sp. 14]|uniref:PepSY-associated TM helix domain-containing protein n=1 Tax=Methylophilus sp. 14 TaxID=2781019 RepID=UPI00188F6498|nr:PepSY-associated TM helix domain-containing protein [Methylophilus sp. 14]MBF4989383.1 PepSY domain-containing protein [Methylophilus sp. 14]